MGTKKIQKRAGGSAKRSASRSAKPPQKNLKRPKVPSSKPSKKPTPKESPASSPAKSSSVTNVLEIGRNAIYKDEVLEDIPEKYHRKYVLKSDSGKVRMVERLQRLASFKQLNLLDEWPMKGPFDVIFCRNVVIYFSKDLQRVIFDKYANLLKPNGWLYIGHSENLFNISNRFESVGKTIYRKVK